MTNAMSHIEFKNERGMDGLENKTVTNKKTGMHYTGRQNKQKPN